MTTLKPLADRVLVVPDLPPETTESGLSVVQAWQPITTGTVAAIGDKVRDVRVGDDIIFSWQVGQEVTLDDGKTRYFLMRETDIQAVMTPEVSA